MKRYNPSKPILIPFAFFAITTVAILLCWLFCGCATIEKIVDKVIERVEEDKTPAEPYPDEIAYNLLQWKYGGYSAPNAATDTVPRIKNLVMHANSLTYEWADVDLSAWGMAHTSAEAICSLFIKDNSGNWVGGKFDWISTSRISRGLSHITAADPYKNWGDLNWSNIPNPAEVVFVITSANARARTNTITATWKR